MAIETPNPGWVALAWPETPNVMIGSTAVIATSSAANGNIGVFELTAKSVPGIEEVTGGVAARRLSQAAVSITAVRLQPSYTCNYVAHNPWHVSRRCSVDGCRQSAGPLFASQPMTWECCAGNS